MIVTIIAERISNILATIETVSGERKQRAVFTRELAWRYQLILLPTMLPNQRDELARSKFFNFPRRFGLGYSDQSLRFARFADRDDQAAANAELCNQWIRNLWSTGGHQDCIVWRVRVPSECAVKSLYRGVVDSQFANPRLCFTG